jgi:hypothetical protein
MLVRDLALAERHVADGREHASRQQGIISRLEAAGLAQTTNVARQLLHSMLKGLALFVDGATVCGTGFGDGERVVSPTDRWQLQRPSATALAA